MTFRPKKEHSVAELRKFINGGGDINETDAQGCTRLVILSGLGAAAAVKFLLDLNADVYVEANGGDTALHRAAEYGKLSVARLLVNANAPVDHQNWKGETPLHLAAKIGKGGEVMVKFLLNRWADPNKVTKKSHSTPLHYAAEVGDLPTVQALLDGGAEPNACELWFKSEADCPLHKAVIHGHVEVVECLLNAGADLAREGAFKKTPMSLALEHGHVALVQLLQRKEAEKTPIVSSQTRYPAADAARAARRSADRLSRSSGTDRVTTLHDAATDGDVAALTDLLDVRVDPNIADRFGFQALHLACKYKHHECVRVLLERKADVNSKTPKGFTPLHYAAGYCKAETVELLIKHGGALNAEDQNGKSPLDWAVGSRGAENRELLLKAGAKSAYLSGSGLQDYFRFVKVAQECPKCRSAMRLWGRPDGTAFVACTQSPICPTQTDVPKDLTAVVQDIFADLGRSGWQPSR
jgi:ankyrin repeat protein